MSQSDHAARLREIVEIGLLKGKNSSALLAGAAALRAVEPVKAAPHGGPA